MGGGEHSNIIIKLLELSRNALMVLIVMSNKIDTNMNNHNSKSKHLLGYFGS